MSVAPPRAAPRSVAVAVQGKGASRLVGRAVAIGNRYGVTPARMTRRLDRLVAVLDRHHATATLPVTAAAVARHPRALAPYVERGIEFAVHGLHHVDHLGLDAATQRAHLQRACDIMEASGVPVEGFRAPYLRGDGHTLAAVRQAGLRYDASPAIHWPVDPAVDDDGYRRGLAFYGAAPVAQRPSVPWLEDGVLRIPYSLPDDESLVDRLQLDPDRIAQVWLGMFEATHAAGELLTLSLHPERIDHCAQGIDAVLAAARAHGPRVWVAGLGQVARWWQARAQTSVRVLDAGEGRIRLRVRGPAAVTLVGRGLGLPGGRTWGPDTVSTARDLVLDVDGRRPFVGVHPRCPAAVGGLLRAAGHVVEATDRPDTHARFVDVPRLDPGEGRRLLAAMDADGPPLVRLGRWPDGARSVVAVTGDVDALTVGDFAWRMVGR